MAEDLFVGIDLGATSIKAATYTESRGVGTTLVAATEGRPLPVLRGILRKIVPTGREGAARVAVTGSGRNIIGPEVALPSENEIISVARGAGVLCGGVLELVEIGGQLSKWIQLHADGTLSDYSMNDLCAGGSGSFLEQQATRLMLDLPELSRLAAAAPSGATIAGRCSVFAKTDMIHLQQKGTPVDRIAYGLCLAVARNFMATILKGRELHPPVAFIGGGSLNPGLVRAFREALDLNEKAFFVPENSCHFGAVGAALLAGQSDTGLSVRELEERLADMGPDACRPPGKALAPLHVPTGRSPRQEPQSTQGISLEVFLGVDVGSVSTEIVVLDLDGEVTGSVYAATRGRPLEVLGECLKHIRETVGDGLRILGVGATGSGRHLAGQFLGADVVTNEITAQAVSTIAYFPKVDTVLEIGGQDSKYISVQGGVARDFAMNKVCAAGTGSFLEEQAERLGISIVGEFADLALAGKSPVDLGSRCTVFMDSELSEAQQRGTCISDITAGLAYAIARNYLEKVVARSPIGDHVVFQGGVASNRAVVAAFESILGRTIDVHPYNRISGAIGAALLVRSSYKVHPAVSAFYGFETFRDYGTRSFECDQCSNRCEVKKLTFDGRAVFFGDACERYSGLTESAPSSSSWPNLFEERETLLSRYLEEPVTGPDRGTIGIPRATLLHELLPLWSAFFKRLGYDVELSSRSSSHILASGLRKLPVEACLPVKVTFGHVMELIEEDDMIDFIFLPSLCPLPSQKDEGNSVFPCPYAEHLPYMVRAVTEKTRLLTPQIALGGGAAAVQRTLSSMGEVLGVDKNDITNAFDAALEKYEDWLRSLVERGKEVLRGHFDKAFVILGRPYNMFDPFQNLNLAQHLRHLDCVTIPMSFLPTDHITLSADWDELLWKLNRDVIRAAEFVKQDERLFPIVLSSFGCGPDGFALKHLEKLFGNRPHLFLEFDEHRGEAGLITRLEAFLDEVNTFQCARISTRPPQAIEVRGASTRKGSTVFVPYFADHAYAFAGAFRLAGYKAEVLPPSDRETERMGHLFCSGKECHPYVLMAGDLISLAHSGKASHGDTFFFPSPFNFPCLLSQYRSGYLHILAELDKRHIHIRTMHSQDMRDFFGLAHCVLLWQALVAIDLLIKSACEKRPYELQQGETSRIHQENLRDIEEVLAGGRLVDAIDRCVQRLAAIAVSGKRTRPVVGVAGDVYTRTNAFANDNLFVRLEAMGCEVWPAPFIVDAFDFVVRKDLADSLARKRFSNVLGDGFVLLLKEFSRGPVRRKFMGLLRDLDEPAYEEVLRQTTPYADPKANYIVLLNIAKMVDFARNGADGVINAMGLNCMVGTISAALLRTIRADHDNIPMANLVYGEGGGLARQARLEAFVHQSKAHHKHVLGV
jgi:predicted CoA-substrate-specific enzyme activase